jgi:hypothetical protein
MRSAGAESLTEPSVTAYDSFMAEDIAYRVEFTAAQLKVVHTALKSLLDDFGHDEADVVRVIHDVLDKLPDEHSIRAIDLDDELRRNGSR